MEGGSNSNYYWVLIKIQFPVVLLVVLYFSIWKFAFVHKTKQQPLLSVLLCYFVICCQVLDLLWSLSHLPSLTTELVDQALRSHIEILSDSYAVKEQIKKNYAIKCVEDIKKGVLIVPAIRQLLKITRGMVKQQFNKNDKVWCRKFVYITSKHF